MIIWGNYDRDRNEDTGRFECPQCGVETDFTLVRTWNYFHIYFIPVAKQRLVAERIHCQECHTAFPITALAGTAQAVASAFDSGLANTVSVADNFGNVVELSDAAVEEVRRRHSESQFGSDVVVRVAPGRMGPQSISIVFDFPLADGRDWIGQSQGIPVVVDRSVAPELQGSTVDFCDGEFVRTYL